MVSKEQSDGFNICLTNATKKMVGNVLTILEATGMSGSQAKAVKDMVKQEMWGHHEEVWHFFWNNVARPNGELIRDEQYDIKD